MPYTVTNNSSVQFESAQEKQRRNGEQKISRGGLGIEGQRFFAPKNLGTGY